MQLAVTQERQADLEEAVIQAERRLTGAREQLRTLERRAQEAQYQTRALAARQGDWRTAITLAESGPKHAALSIAASAGTTSVS